MRRHRKAVSTVVATVLMTTLTLTLGITAFFWAAQTFGLQVGNAGVYFQNSSKGLLENIVIEDVWFDQTGGKATAWVTVRNVGTIDVKLVAIYTNSTSQTSTTPSITNGITIGVGKAVSIQVSTNYGYTWPSSPSNPQFVYISVATARGTDVRGYWSTTN
jgi:hypothetical protein